MCNLFLEIVYPINYTDVLQKLADLLFNSTFSVDFP